MFERLLFAPFAINTRKEYWRLLTHGFVHGSGTHLFVNMLVLYMFGPTVASGLEGSMPVPGSYLLILIYLLAIPISAWPSYHKHQWNPNYKAVGASGATSAIVFASVLLFPASKMLLLILPIPLPAWLFGPLYLVYEGYMARRGQDAIAHDAHLYGALFGLGATAILVPGAISGFVQAVANAF
jgi:membrane associated rhomboid family serine protease